MTGLKEIGARAKQGADVLAYTLSGDKNRALEAIADKLDQNIPLLLEANGRDVAAARDNGISDAMVDRLRLTAERIHSIAEAVRYVVGLEDPIGGVLGGNLCYNNIHITKVVVPLGVVGVIYESRPNVTVDCAALCMKSGNACILRGGKEAIHSNTALVKLMQEALVECGLSPHCVQLVEDTSRETARAMMRMNGVIDVLIPRGGAGLIQTVIENATVPVIETGVGNCHIYVDYNAEIPMAVNIIDNAKTSRPSVCNAAETLLVHRDIAEEFLPKAAERLWEKKVELRGCEETRRILGDNVVPATEADYATEFLDYILAVRVVKDVFEAVEHVNRYSTKHSETIVTRDLRSSQIFTGKVDSAALYVNASTRFTDGGVFGLGAEIGISTQKLHVRGPMGIQHLTSYKYICVGDGQIRS